MSNWLDKKLAEDPDWHGIHLLPPSKITKDKVVINGFNFFAADSSGGGPLKIFAANKKTGQKYNSRFSEEYPPDVYPTPAPDPDVTPPRKEELAGLSSGGPFDFNLLYQIEDLSRPGTYDVYVTWAGHTSNTITVKI